jgi:hypothetical protein
MTTATDTQPKAAPMPQFFEVKEWAQANRLGVNAVYEFCRIKRDPIPHIRRGRKILIDDHAAQVWIRRRFGRGYGEAK